MRGSSIVCTWVGFAISREAAAPGRAFGWACLGHWLPWIGKWRLGSLVNAFLGVFESSEDLNMVLETFAKEMIYQIRSGCTRPEHLEYDSGYLVYRTKAARDWYDQADLLERTDLWINPQLFTMYSVFEQMSQRTGSRDCGSLLLPWTALCRKLDLDKINWL